MDPISRRDALRFGLAATSLAPALALSGCGLADGKTLDPKTAVEPGLSSYASARGILYGAACEAQHLDRDPDFAAAFLRECALLVAQNELKWGVVRPAPGKFDFSRPDRLAMFARDHALRLRGHAMVWHIGNPAWLKDALAGGKGTAELEEHIWGLAGRYRGHVQSWDVVNEAVEPLDGRRDGLRKTSWLAAMGPGYIGAAFHFAHAADPSAKLVYNDYGLDYADDMTAMKADAVLALLAKLKAEKVPVDALGIQAHLRAGRKFNAARMIDFLDCVEALGLDVYITELDINDLDLPRKHGRRDMRAAHAVSEYLTTVLAHRAVKLVATWGLSDRYTFRNEAEFRHWLWTSRPLPLDPSLARKPMWHAMKTAFQDATNRSAAA